MSNPHDLKWTARLDRRLVGRHGGKHHILVDVTAPSLPVASESQRPPLNLGLVIDASGSMSGGPLQAACEAARGVIKALDAKDRLTIVSFSDDVIVHTDVLPVDEAGRQAALREINLLHTRGSTNLAAGWLEGCERLALEMERQQENVGAPDAARYQNRVILLSDGYANQGLVDPEALGLRAAGLRQRGLYTSTVGIGDGYSPVQLEAIAEHGGGRLHDAPLGEDIVAVVLGELGEILGAAANDLTLMVRHSRHVSVKAFGRLPCAFGDGSVQVSLGGLTTGATRHVVLQVEVPAGSEGDRFTLTLEPSWRTPDGEPMTAPPFAVELVRVSEAERAAELPDNAVLKRIAELWHNHVVLDSTLLNSEGRYAEARNLVCETLAEFRSYCAGVPDTDWLVPRLEQQGSDVANVMGADVSLNRVALSKHLLKQTPDFRVNQRRGPQV